MISNDPGMIFRLELLIKSIKLFSSKNVFFSVVINGNEKKLFNKKIKLETTTIGNKYISKNSDLYFCPYHWSIPYPSRWFIDPKEDMCVFIDADMVACSSTDDLYKLEKNMIHGVSAYQVHLEKKEWEALGLFEFNVRNYINFGMVVVPSYLKNQIGDEMLKCVPKVFNFFKNKRYFSGQVALACAMQNLNLKINILPKKFNWYDTWPAGKTEEIIFLHYFNKKDGTNSAEQITYNKNKDKYFHIINEILQKTSNKTFM